MKRTLYVLAIITLLLSACEHVTEPVVEPNQLNKQFDNSSDQASGDLNFSIIPLPEKSPIYMDSIFTVTKIINGLLGGTVTLDRLYISREGKLVTIVVNLVVPPLAFTGQREISVTIEDSVAVMNCGPSINFRRPLLLVQTFTGLDLRNYDTGKINFVYIHDDGTFSNVPKTAMMINKQLGIVSVLNAKLSHFSKYGWVR